MPDHCSFHSMEDGILPCKDRHVRKLHCIDLMKWMGRQYLPLPYHFFGFVNDALFSCCATSLVADAGLSLCCAPCHALCNAMPFQSLSKKAIYTKVFPLACVARLLELQVFCKFKKGAIRLSVETFSTPSYQTWSKQTRTLGNLCNPLPN